MTDQSVICKRPTRDSLRSSLKPSPMPYMTSNPRARLTPPLRRLAAGWIALACLVTAGCDHPPPPPPPAAVPEVEVCLPVNREVTDREEFTGQTEAVKTIDIRARVTGYLKAVDFQHGAEVKQGELLFEIDPPYYEAEADRAAGVVA